jgi:hypothetical protein
MNEMKTFSNICAAIKRLVSNKPVPQKHIQAGIIIPDSNGRPIYVQGRVEPLMHKRIRLNDHQQSN